MANYNVASLQDAYLAILDLNNRVTRMGKNLSHATKNFSGNGSSNASNTGGGGGGVITPQVNSDWIATSGPSFILNKPPITYNSGTSLTTVSSNLAVISAITCYSADKSHYVYLNGSTTNATINTNTPALEFICACQFDSTVNILGTLTTAGLTVTSAATTSTTITISNTSTNGRGMLIQECGSANINPGFFTLSDLATGNLILAISGAVSARKVIRLAASSVIGWSVDDAAGGADVGLQRYAAGTLLCSDTNGTPASLISGAITVYSADKSRYMYINGGTNPPTISTNASGISFTCYATFTSTGGITIYSADASRYLQISCANGANPIIASSTSNMQLTGNIFVTGTGNFSSSIAVTGTVSGSARLTSGGDITISASGTGTAGSYLQMSDNGQFGDPNPWIYSSTSWIISNSNIGFKSGAGWAVYGPGTGTSYLSTGWSGANPSLTSSTGLIVISGGIAVSANSSFSGFVDATGASAAFRTLSGCPGFYAYNTANTQYGAFTFAGNANPIIVSTTNILQINPVLAFAALDTCMSRYAAGTLLCSDSSGTPASAIAGNFTAYNAGKTVYVYMNGGTSPPAIVTNAAQLTVQTALLYVTGQVSALSHITHASGTDILDIQKAFTRTEPITLEKDLVEPVIDENAWALVPGPEGLHILVKRALGKVVEFILPWEQAKEVN